MKKIITVILIIYFQLFLSCEKFPPGDVESEAPNNPPNTTLANIPMNGATLYALVKMMMVILIIINTDIQLNTLSKVMMTLDHIILPVRTQAVS